MAQRKINVRREGSGENVDKTHVYKGSTQDLLKARARDFNKMADEVERILADWSGGGLCLVMNNYDENNNVTGNTVVVLGADDIEGLVKLSKGVHKASEHIIETTVSHVSDSVGAEGLMQLLMSVMKEGEED